jgi:hypothetical protein
MGDAGPLTPPPAAEPQIGAAAAEHETSTREVTVLVTGFGVCATAPLSQYICLLG